MKKKMANYIARFIECQKVNTKHTNLFGLLQPLAILEWKWEVVTMDFMTKLFKTLKKHDSIMVVEDKLNKATHFIPVNTTQGKKYCRDLHEKIFQTAWSAKGNHLR
jgi:hypothetical protein